MPTIMPSHAPSRTTTIQKRPALIPINNPSAQSFKQPSILIVDDNAINLRLLHTFLVRKSYTAVFQATDGVIANDVFAGATPAPDIVFMDLSMPIRNGIEATRRIRALEATRASLLSPTDRAAPALIIALTGLASARDQAEAFEAGVDLYMTKPVSFKLIAQVLEKWERNGGSEANLPKGSLSASDVGK